MKVKVSIQPCPWCKITPKLVCPIDGDTWLWRVECHNDKCKIRPQSAYTPIRKTCKRDFMRILVKLKEIVSSWNDENPIVAIEATILDLSRLNLDVKTTTGSDFLVIF